METETATAIATTTAAPPSQAPAQATLQAVERRVLWLATAIVDAANHGRPNSSGLKVGGHQASSASMVSIMTALWFGELTAADRVSVKPHASPVLHAINYLLGDLDAAQLPRLRAKGGLQSYPSRTKDPDTVDFSTGSVGIGATAPLWAAIADRYVRWHRLADAGATAGDTATAPSTSTAGAAHDPGAGDRPPPAQPAGGRWISLLGDAELDEGAVWEAVADPAVARLGELLWVVDLNRQSLDRVVPDIQISRLQGMFAAAGWEVLTCKWGRRLEDLYGRPGGGELRRRLEEMSNEEYQRLLRCRPGELHDRLVEPAGALAAPIRRLVAGLDPAQLAAAIRDLGGHDLELLARAYREADRERPTVVFAYTIKGFGLPIEGHPGNHSMLLSPEQMVDLAERLAADAGDPWATFPDGSAERALCEAVAQRLHRPAVVPRPLPDPPASLGRRHAGSVSTQAALGRFLVDLRREAPALAARVVTVSPDVASSTNLGSWINQVGVWSVGERRDWFADDEERLLKWVENPGGQHIELGIAETNLVGLLGELGASWSRSGEPLLPIGTLYDPFVSRALEPWSFGIYAGGQSILVGTPSGVTLAPEGGAHQSIITPSIGLEQPACTAYEPAFAQDLEWCLLDALGRLGRPGGRSAYFRLSTRPLDQSLAASPVHDAAALEQRRLDVLAGGYRIPGGDAAAGEADRVLLVGAGALLPEVLAAADELRSLGVATGVVSVTSADLLFQALQSRRGLSPAPAAILDRLFPPAQRCPLVTVLDGHPHTLAFLAGVRGDPITCLGVTEFGQSADLAETYALHGIDTATIVGAAFDLLEA